MNVGLTLMFIVRETETSNSFTGEAKGMGAIVCDKCEMGVL